MSPGGAKRSGEEPRCSFCGRPESQTSRMFSGRPLAKKGGQPTPFICADCVRQAQEESVEIRELGPDDRAWAEKLVCEYFVTPQVVSGETLVDTRELPGIIATQDEKPVGLLQFQTTGSECEVVVLISDQPRQGIGKTLLRALEGMARKRSWDRLWLHSTNDNLVAAALFESLNWKRVAVDKGAVKAARRIKPEIPARAADGTPIEDVVKFEKRMS